MNAAVDKALVIRTRMENDSRFLLYCLCQLYKQQEEDEQGVKETLHQNGAGFNKADASYLTYAVRQLQKRSVSLDNTWESFSDPIFRILTTGIDIDRVRKQMLKYAKQLSNLIEVV
jgi:hypothetical protein